MESQNVDSEETIIHPTTSTAGLDNSKNTPSKTKKYMLHACNICTEFESTSKVELNRHIASIHTEKYKSHFKISNAISAIL